MISTADLYDAHPDLVRVCETQFRSYGGVTSFCGPCATIAAFEDHTPVLKMLQTPGEGRVLVVDGQGSLRIGLMGDRLAGIAVENGWCGVVLNGVIRDTSGIGGMRLGVKALGATARKSWQETPGTEGHPLHFGGVSFSPGDWLYADQDCVVISSKNLQVQAKQPSIG